MNIRSKNSIIVLFVGLLSIPQSLLVASVGAAPLGLQVLPAPKPAMPNNVEPAGENDDDKKQKESDLDDVMSAKRFGADPTSVFLAPPREFVRPLARAIRIQNEGDHVHAAELIGQFLIDMGEEDFLIFNDKAKGTAVSVRSVANEMLSSLPESAREAYRVRFGVLARQRLNLAVSESNYFEIAQVKQRFLYTEAGLEAAMLLGHHHFDAGRILLAAESFQTALGLTKQQGKLDSKLSILTAVSWVLARRPVLAEAVMNELAKANGGKFRLGDQDVTIDEAEPLAAIKTFVDAGPLDSSSAVDQWLLVGGNARRNVTTMGGFPVGQPMWEVDLDASKEVLQKIKNNREREVAESDATSLVPANVPLVVDGLVLVGNKNKIQAVDFDSGKRVWAVKAVDAGAKEVPSNRSYLNNSIATPWSDFLQGHASSDGKFIFRVVKSASAQPSKVSSPFGIGGRYSSSVTSDNTLQAIDVLKQGELAWEAGGGKTTGDPRLTQINFLGAPLPVDGVLYAIGQRLEEVVLVALNSADGKLLWLQSLASNENLSLSHYVRPATFNSNYSLRPSYSDGILVCPTGKNALVAIDTVGRRLLWGMQTTVGSTPRSPSTNSLDNLKKTLRNPQVFIENSRIVAFDVSGEPRLLAMDLLDGSPLMKIGKAGVKCADVLHVASVDEDQVVLVEKTRVRAISSDSGRSLWATSIADFGPPTGRGYVAQVNEGTESKLALYLPTHGNTIIKIDLENEGKIVDGVRANRSFGNLIVHQGRVVSRRENSVACFELDSKVVAKLKTAIDEAGGIEQLTPELKIKRAALLRNQGKPRRAIELLKTIDASDRLDRFKVEFLQNATLMFDGDPEFALRLFKEHESWFQFETNPKLFLGYVELLVKNNLVDDMLKQIFQDDSFFTPSDSFEESRLLQRPIAGYNFPNPEQQPEADGNETEGEEPAGQDGVADQKNEKDVPVGANSSSSTGNSSSFVERQKKFSKSKIAFDPNHWAKTQLIRTAREFPESKAKIQEAIEQRLKTAKISDAVQRHRLYRQFPLELIAPKLRFELAEQLIARKHVAEAENMLASLLGFLPTKAEQIETVDSDLSKDSLRRLWQSVREAQYGAKAKPAMAGDNVKTSLLKGLDRVELSASRVPVENQSFYFTPVEVRGKLAGESLKDKRLVVWGQGPEIEILNANGESEKRFVLFDDSPASSVSLRSGSGWLQANHTLAVLRQNDLLMTVDLSKLELGRPSVLWYKNVAGRKTSRSDIAGEMDLVVGRMLAAEDVVASFPMTGCCCFIEKNNLVCVDAFTGKTLWTRTKDDRHTSILGNNSQVVTMDSKQTMASVFDIRTGERVKKETISGLTEFVLSVDGMSFLSTSSVLESGLEGLKALVDYRPKVVEKESKDGQKNDTNRVRFSSRIRFLSRYDVGANEFVWKKVFGVEARVCRMAGDRILVLSADNQIYIFDAKSGDELAKMPSGLTDVERKKIRYVGAIEHAGKDLVALVTTKKTSISWQAYRVRPARTQNNVFSGHLLLLSKGDHQPAWSRPVEVAGFQLLPVLPSASPFLIFNRVIQSRSALSNPKLFDPPIIPRDSLQLLGIDIRTGKVAMNKIFRSETSIKFTPSLYDPVADTVEVKFSGWELKLAMKKAVDEPPSPVGSVTIENPIPRNYSTERRVVEVAESNFDIEKLNEQLVRKAEQYEASLEQKRNEERALLESEANQPQ